MGNYCRSPTAQGVFEKLIENCDLTKYIEVDSAGTHTFHLGKAPDPRCQKSAKNRGYSIEQIKSRLIKQEDYSLNDLVLVMDWDNYAIAENQCNTENKHKILLLAQFCSKYNLSTIPDPYYDVENGFEYALDLIEDACRGLLKYVQKRLRLNKLLK